MGIFEKTVDAIREADLQLMGFPESLILEYKRDLSDWNDIVKELVAFANTFGGHLILGATGDRSGRLTGLPGIAPQTGFEQAVIQRCSTGVVPPLTSFPSPPIALAGTMNVAYIVYVPPSYGAPHFLVNRGGAYVRVAEHSRPVQVLPAEWRDLQHLAERRTRAIEQRTFLQQRAGRRATSSPMAGGVLMEFFACPSFPTQALVELGKLREVTVDVQSPAVRGRMLTDAVVAAAESIVNIQQQGASHRRYYEMTTYGSLYVADVINFQPPLRAGGPPSVELLGVLTDTLLWLDQARFVFERIGYEGPIGLSLTLRHMKGTVFVWGSPGQFGLGPTAEPRFDEDVAQEMETTTADMANHLRADAWSLFPPIAYAIDMREILGEDKDKLIQQAVDRLASLRVTIPQAGNEQPYRAESGLEFPAEYHLQQVQDLALHDVGGDPVHRIFTRAARAPARSR